MSESSDDLYSICSFLMVDHVLSTFKENCFLWMTNFYVKQKHLGCKKIARLIRSSMQAGRCDQKS